MVMLALLSSTLFPKNNGDGKKTAYVEAASTFDFNGDAWEGQDDRDDFDDTQTGSFPPPNTSNGKRIGDMFG